METRICSNPKCKKEKPLTEEFFRFRKDTQNYNLQCKVCVNEQRKHYRQNNKEKIANQRKEYYKNNKDKILDHKKEYYENNIEKIIEYRENNKEKKHCIIKNIPRNERQMIQFLSYIKMFPV